MKVILLAAFVFGIGVAAAQKSGQSLIDSLVAALPAMKADTNKVKTFNRIAQTYMQVNQQQGFGYANSGLALAGTLQWKKGMANLHNTLGLLIGDTGNNTLARVHFEESLVLNKELDSKFNLITNLNNIARSYQRESNYTTAISYYFQALDIAEKMQNNEQIALVGTGITASFITQKNYPKANEYAEMTLRHAQLARVPNHIGKSLLFLGLIKMYTRDTVAARVFMGRALQVYKDMNNQPAMAQVLVNMAQLEYPDYKKEILRMQEAQDILDAVSPGALAVIVNIANLASTYYQLALQSKAPDRNAYLQKAEAFLKRGDSLCRLTGNTEYQATILLSMADIEETKGNYKSALDHYKTANAINDSLFSQDKKNEIAGLDGKYTIALKDNEIAFNQLALSAQRRTQLGLVAALLLLGTIGGLLYWQGRNRKKTNTTLMVLNNQLDEANKVKAKFFGILSHDLRGPVSNLIHFLHLQKNDPDLLGKEEQAVHQQMISQSAEDLLNNMEAMLLWSKEQMDDFRPTIKNIAVSDLFGYLQKFFPQTGLVQFQFSQEPGLQVMADENYLQIIMQNLTANALKALQDTPKASIAWSAWKEGATTLLSITDNGPGISPEQVKALYEDANSMTAKSGFGLHLIRDLARAIRYQITIRSQPGMGTTFTLESE